MLSARSSFRIAAHVRRTTSSALDNLHNAPNDPATQIYKNSHSLVTRKKVFRDGAGGKSRLDLLSQASKYPLSLEAAARMKFEGVRPDVQVYHALMLGAGLTGMWLHAWAIWDDMLLVGIKPDVTLFNHLIHAHRHRPSSFLWKIFDKMNEFGVQPNNTTYAYLITHFVADGNLELALQYFHEMKTREMTPPTRVVDSIVELAAELGHPRLALDVATWFETTCSKQLEHGTWTKILASSAEMYYAEGVQYSWAIIVNALNLTPDEGVCLAVLYTAARHGLPDLATDVLRVLKSAKVEWQEHHFACVVEAFSRASHVKEAFLTLEIMRNNNTPANLRTTRSILDHIGKNTDTLDASWEVIEEIHKEKGRVDTAALNVLVQASVELGDLQRAMGSYKSFKEYDAVPDVETFNTLLDGCVASKHRQLGDMLLDDMKAAKVKPDAGTFEKMIYLCLGQDTYEDAFFYLEEMKASRLVPPVTVYASIVRKCLSADDARYRLAVQEMGEAGYDTPASLSREIKGYLRRGGKGEAMEEVTEKVRLDGAAQRFIETGGLGS